MCQGSSHVGAVCGYVDAIRRVPMAIRQTARASERRSRNGNTAVSQKLGACGGGGSGWSGDCRLGFFLDKDYCMTPRYYNHLMRFSRREFLGTSSLVAAGCAARRNPVAAGPPVTPPVRLARVRVSADRVIRTIAGLRPFRPSGFVVRGEKLDGKTVIHNYGHGGAGITLSWGTSQLAGEERGKTGVRHCAGLCCDGMGLSPARPLQPRGYSVT